MPRTHPASSPHHTRTRVCRSKRATADCVGGELADGDPAGDECAGGEQWRTDSSATFAAAEAGAEAGTNVLAVGSGIGGAASAEVEGCATLADLEGCAASADLEGCADSAEVEGRAARGGAGGGGAGGGGAAGGGVMGRAARL